MCRPIDDKADHQSEAEVFEAFSEEALRLIFFSRYEAGRLRFEAIDVSHFLLGFILEDQGRSELRMRSLMTWPETSDSEPVAWSNQSQSSEKPFLDSVVADKLQAIFSRLGPRSEPQPPHGDMPLTEEAQHVLRSLVEHAGGSAVTPLHLLWAMLDHRAGPVANALKESGITREDINAAIHRRS